MSKPQFRTQFTDYCSDDYATLPGEDEGLVQQHMRDECDVNVIMRRYQQTGELTHISALAGEYGDFSDLLDYRDGLNQIEAANELFMELPSTVRDRFKNNPGEFLDFAANPDHLDEMIEMGLAPQKIVPPAAGPLPEEPQPDHTPSQSAKT